MDIYSNRIIWPPKKSYEAPAQSPWDYLIFTTAGAAVYHAGSISLKIGAGSLLFIPRGTPHASWHVHGPKPWAPLWTQFTLPPEWQALWTYPPTCGHYVRLSVPSQNLSQIKHHFEALIAIQETPSALASLHARNRLERLLLDCLELLPPPSIHRDARVSTLIAYIEKQLAEPLDVSGMAAHVGLSAPRLTKLFAENGYPPPMRYLEQRRLARARDLVVYSQRPMANIACLCGFSDPLYFSRRFRRAFGLPPRSYREKHRQLSLFPH